MKVSNQTSDQDQVKICLYDPNSPANNVLPVGSGVFVVPKGKTVPWTPPNGERLDKYHLKAFHPAIFDKYLADAQVGVNEEVAVTGSGGKYSVDKL